MRALVISAAIASALLLTSCGSATETSSGTPAPVESAPDTGAVAASGDPFPPCPEGPPATGSLLSSINGDPDHDGVVGAIINKTG